MKYNEDNKLPLVNQSDHILQLARHRRVLRAAVSYTHLTLPTIYSV